MITGTAASIVNLLGFITGVVLYVMLLWMVLTSRAPSNRLLLLTGVLGFAWNAGGFGGYGLANLGFTASAPFVLAAAFSALCFLPSFLPSLFTPHCGPTKRPRTANTSLWRLLHME
jgi:hypothetical protein